MSPTVQPIYMKTEDASSTRHSAAAHQHGVDSSCYGTTFICELIFGDARSVHLSKHFKCRKLGYGMSANFPCGIAQAEAYAAACGIEA